MWRRGGAEVLDEAWRLSASVGGPRAALTVAVVRQAQSLPTSVLGSSPEWVGEGVLTASICKHDLAADSSASCEGTESSSIGGSFRDTTAGPLYVLVRSLSRSTETGDPGSQGHLRSPMAIPSLYLSDFPSGHLPPGQ